ncbi:YpeB-like protein with putative protease inhibitory function [Dongia mobilis]|uniref:YpeB-like protein with putative protease inhibitory function n=1 Tax=Dongia mobilis TaxID=578943 RepID=A0A4R6WF11_9PROT|nr:PepSY domain-containing protein [Dongia mobilis]TDQ78482.1 YpeB-like protein with putative protease inhibitory function [Dongia mobilis]
MTRVILERLIAARIVLAILAALSIIILSAMIPAFAQDAQPNLPSGNNCTEGEVIDSSTPEDAKRKFEAAGYSNVVITSKGCDNFWHATAVKDGMPVNVVLAPDGLVLTEGN